MQAHEWSSFILLINYTASVLMAKYGYFIAANLEKNRNLTVRVLKRHEVYTTCYHSYLNTILVGEI